MKFKNEKSVFEGQDARILTITDKDGDTLAVRLFVDGKPQVIVSVNDIDPGVAMTRSKALKLAWAIINELQPDWETAF